MSALTRDQILLQANSLSLNISQQVPQTALSLKTLWVDQIMIDVSRLIAFGLAILITILIFIFLKKTTTGKRIRAASDNRTGAILVGIDVDRIHNAAFALGAATTAAAGVLLVPLMPISPHMGHDFTLTAFIVVILGIFLVYNSISAIVSQQTDQIGVMKAIGASGWQVLNGYLPLVIAYGMLAAAVSTTAKISSR